MESLESLSHFRYSGSTKLHTHGSKVLGSKVGMASCSTQLIPVINRFACTINDNQI